MSDPLDHHLVGRLEAVAPVSLASLRKAGLSFARRMERKHWIAAGSRHRISVAALAVDEGVFRELIEDDDRGWLVGHLFDSTPRSTVVHFEGERCWLSFSSAGEGEVDSGEVTSILRPYLERHGASAEVKVAARAEYEPPGFSIDVEIHPEFGRGATLADAWRIGEDAAKLIDVVDGDEIPHSMALDLLRSGRWGVFKGRPESGWLEAKGAPYAEANARLAGNWRYELAKDVAAFANSPDGGIIVIGMTTADEGDGEVITGFREFDLNRVTASTYGNHVAQLVHPQVEGFEVVRVRGEERNRGIVALMIPRQDPSNVPFLVRGTVSGGKVLGNHVLWPVRQGDRTAVLDADGLHTRLRLGDQAIKS